MLSGLLLASLYIVHINYGSDLHMNRRSSTSQTCLMLCTQSGSVVQLMLIKLYACGLKIPYLIMT